MRLRYFAVLFFGLFVYQSAFAVCYFYPKKKFKGKALRINYTKYDINSLKVIRRRTGRTFPAQSWNDEIASYRCLKGMHHNIVVCKHTNYRGCQRLKYSYSTNLGHWKNKISSIYNYKRYQARVNRRRPNCRVFKHRHYKGKSLLITRDYIDLHSAGFGDNISSIWCTPGAAIKICKHKGFRKCFILSKSIRNLKNDLRYSRLHDEISSILIVRK